MSSPGARIWRPRELSPASIRRKLSALSSLFDYLCERNAVAGNPVDGVKRPTANGNEGSTPALGDAQARKLLDAPPADTLKGVRDRAILATLLYHGIRREELCSLRVKDMQTRQGVLHFRDQGQEGKDQVRSRASDGATADRAIIWRSPGTAAMLGRPPLPPRRRTTARARSTGISIPAPSTATSSRNTAGRPASAPKSTAYASIRCARRPRRTRSPMKPTSPRCRNGSATRMSPRRASMTGARASPRTARHFSVKY